METPPPARRDPSGGPPPLFPTGGAVRVKVCGVTSVAAALACAEAGADWVGLNFHPPSPRYVPPERAAEIAAALAGRCEPVGLFVDRPPAEVADVAARVGLRVVQLHGDEPPEDLLHLAEYGQVRAFRLGDAAAVGRMLAYLERAERLGRVPDAVLVDGYVAGQAGGTGHAIAWEVLDALPRFTRLVLAGGLTPANVAERVARLRPWMVDVASGVESVPGVKDPEQVSAFVRAARGG